MTSPPINEVVVIMLGSILGIKFTVLYVVTGLSLGILAGVLVDALKAHRWLQLFFSQVYLQEGPSIEPNSTAQSTPKMTFQQRHQFAANETGTIVKRIWSLLLQIAMKFMSTLPKWPHTCCNTIKLNKLRP
ncbi:permease [Vibrio chaetopteri]|uniref:permease n=1 Tax=Vibrio chaetopteri TaxID=3016528 RepID=UPI003AB40825